MQIVCLDLEGVLVPEIWIAFSERTGIAEFRRTTRDEPDYDKLMRFRLALLRQHGLKLADIQAVIGAMAPMEGAKAFLDDLRQRFQVLILSDTFYEFADPLMAQLGRPTLFCHRLQTDADGFVAAYHLRQPNQKFQAVQALKGLIDTSSQKVASGARLVHDAGAAMEQIVAGVSRVTEVIAEISAAASATACFRVWPLRQTLSVTVSPG